ncbi:MAG: class I SAM-dependent methyltransferase [Bryobacteraceae bacterium]
MNILDLAGANQGTVSFITNYGHGLYSDDMLLQMDQTFGDVDFFENQLSPRRVEDFLERTLTFPDETFDGALVWDTLQYLSGPLLEVVIDKLWRMLRPGSCMLALFNAAEQTEKVQSYSYRIVDHRTIGMLPRVMRRPSQPFNNRTLEKLFQNFHSVKFFLTRDSLREVIVRR